MKKLCIFMLLMTFVVACNKTDNSSCSPNETTVSADGATSSSGCSGGDTTTPPTTGDGDGTIPGGDSGSGDNDGLPNEATTFSTNVTMINFSSSQAAKLEKAIEIVKLVVASEEFRNRVVNHMYNGKKTYVDNDGFTNEQIYQMILDGAETLQPAKNNQMDLEVEIYTNNLTSTVGYTYPNSKRIWMNTKYFNQYNATGVANNLFHEWLHKLGFGHASSYSVSRDYSVPYAIGDMIEELGKQHL